jgi:hypothetical protein
MHTYLTNKYLGHHEYQELAGKDGWHSEARVAMVFAPGGSTEASGADIVDEF